MYCVCIFTILLFFISASSIRFSCVRLHIFFLSSNQELFDGSLQLHRSLVYWILPHCWQQQQKNQFILHNFYLNSCETFRKIPRIKLDEPENIWRLWILIIFLIPSCSVTKESNQIEAVRRNSAFILCKPNKGNFCHFLFE